MAVMLASREFTKFFMELQCLENAKHGTLRAYDENNCLEAWQNTNAYGF